MYEKLEIEFKKEKARTASFSEELKSYIYSLSTQYGFTNYNLKQIFYLLKNNFTVIPKCGLENCEELRIFNKQNILTVGCCVEHTRKINNLLKYGCDNVSKLDYVKDKIKFSNIEKYGVEFPMQSSGVREKHKQTCLKIFGVENPAHSANIQEKVNTTNLKKYGVKRPMQSPKLFQKMMSTAYAKKEYIWTTGEISLVQGNEPIILKELNAMGYRFDEIVTNPMDMPKITYTMYETEHRYYPDIYIPKENLIIEVKSQYTLNIQWEKNQAKFKAVKEAGYNFKLIIR